MKALSMKTTILVICLLLTQLLGCSNKEKSSSTTDSRPSVNNTKTESKWPESTTPGFKVFYCDYRTGKDVKGENAEFSDIPKIERMMREILNSSENYLGLTDQSDRTLQFMANENGTIQIDMPSPERKGSMVKQATLDECIQVIRLAGPSFAELKIPGLRFEAW